MGGARAWPGCGCRCRCRGRGAHSLLSPRCGARAGGVLELPEPLPKGEDRNTSQWTPFSFHFPVGLLSREQALYSPSPIFFPVLKKLLCSFGTSQLGSKLVCSCSADIVVVLFQRQCRLTAARLGAALRPESPRPRCGVLSLGCSCLPRLWWGGWG